MTTIKLTEFYRTGPYVPNTERNINVSTDATKLSLKSFLNTSSTYWKYAPRDISVDRSHTKTFAGFSIFGWGDLPTNNVFKKQNNNLQIKYIFTKTNGDMSSILFVYPNQHTLENGVEKEISLSNLSSAFQYIGFGYNTNVLGDRSKNYTFSGSGQITWWIYENGSRTHSVISTLSWKIRSVPTALIYEDWNYYREKTYDGGRCFNTTTGRIDRVRSVMTDSSKTYYFVPLYYDQGTPTYGNRMGYRIIRTKRDKGSVENTWVQVEAFSSNAIENYPSSLFNKPFRAFEIWSS